MKVFACVMALCLVAAVYCQSPAASSQAVGANPLVGGAMNAGGGMGNFLTYGAMMGGMGGDAFRRFYMCNMLTGGTNNLLCMTMLQ